KQPPTPPAQRRDAATPPTTSPPWALELANGQRCIFLPDPTERFEDLTQTYLCDAKGLEGSSGGPIGVVYGQPDRSHEPWEVQFMKFEGLTTSSVAVKVAWY